MLKVSGSYWQVHAGEYKQKGASKFEKELVRLDIRHILARANHPQTNGKLERFHGEIERYLHESKEESVHRTTGGRMTAMWASRFTYCQGWVP